jgi:hypothetical protein
MSKISDSDAANRIVTHKIRTPWSMLPSSSFAAAAAAAGDETAFVFAVAKHLTKTTD